MSLIVFSHRKKAAGLKCGDEEAWLKDRKRQVLGTPVKRYKQGKKDGGSVSVFISLLNNVTLLIAVTALYEALVRIEPTSRKLRQAAAGVLFGGAAIVGMLVPLRLQPGLIYDGRSIIITAAALFGGAVPATIAAVLAAVFRLYLGGSGQWAGLATIVGCAIVGLIFRRLVRKPQKLSAASLFGIGVASHLVMLSAQLLIVPLFSGVQVALHIAPTVMALFPAAFMVVGRVIQNIELRNEQETALRKWETLVRFGGWGIAVTEPVNHTLTAVNPALARMYGYTEEEMIGKPAAELFAPERREDWQAHFREAEEKGFHTFESLHRRKDGSTFPISMETTMFRDRGGRPLFCAVNIRDLSDLKQREAELKRRRDQALALFELSRLMVSSLDLNTVLQTATDNIIDLLGMQSAAVYLQEGKELTLAATSPPLPPHFPDDFRRVSPADHPHLHQAIISGQPLLLSDAQDAELTPAERAVCELRRLRTLLYLPLIAGNDVLGILIIGSVDRPRGFDEAEIDSCRTLSNLAALAIVNARLYSSLKQHAEELERHVALRTAELEEKNRELEAFSYSISHDLRAPLRAVKGFTEIIAQRYRSSLPPEAMRYFDNILESTEYMGRMISDLLDYARLGKSTTRLEPVPLRPLLEAIVDEFAPACAESNAAIEIDEELPSVMGSPTLLRRLFTNLIENALKYRRDNVPPRIRISGAAKNGCVELEVADNGIGIAPEFSEKIFNLFQRLHSRERYGGTGVGLAVVKKIAELMEGRVRVESTPGEGSRFIVTLTLAKQKE